MTPVIRFTDDALSALRQLAKTSPELWIQDEADFYAVLAKLNVVDPCEPTKITAAKPIAIPPVTRYPNSSGDITALEFAANLEGLLPQHLTDPNLLAWLSCSHLRDFARTRWPQYAGTTNWVLRHFLAGPTADRSHWSLAGRPLWLARTCQRAAAASGQAFTATAALEHFCQHPEQYHTAVSYDVLANETALAEYAYAVINGAAEHDGRGRILAGALNLKGGAAVIDALPRSEIRSILQSTAQNLKQQKGKKVINVLSLGAGVQSTALALMAEQNYRGIPQPDFAIFADTGWEPKAVYDHLDWLKAQLSYPIYRVSSGNIKESILTGNNPEGRQFLDVPVYVIKPDGKKYVGTRTCTKTFKLKPIYRYLKDEVIKTPKGRPVKDTEVHMWLGISTDESSRRKPSRESWIINTHPLLEHQLSRSQLIAWLQENYPDHVVPKSACIGCPYHSNAAWAKMKAEDPESWNDAVGVDWAIRNLPQAAGTIEGTAYLHRSRKPLTEVDFGNAAEDAEKSFQEECEGFCGI